MRKVVRRSDGSEDTVEGTPEEIREYERIVEREGRKVEAPAPAPEKGRVIKGRTHPPIDNDPFPYIPYIPSFPVPIRPWWTRCGLCFCDPCTCHQTCPPIWPPYKIWCSKTVSMTDCSTPDVIG